MKALTHSPRRLPLPFRLSGDALRPAHRCAPRSGLAVPLALLALAALCGASGARAQETFSEMIAVTEVEVPVRVVGRDGPVAGLTREDFELFDRGEAQTILGFEVREHRSDAAAPLPEGGRGPMTGRAAGRNLLLLVDFSFSRRGRLARALDGIAKGLEDRLGPNDRIAVATYGRISGLNLLVGFTLDRNNVALALDAVRAMLDAKRRRQREILARLHAARFAATSDGRRPSAFEVLSGELGADAALAVLSGPLIYDDSDDPSVRVERQKDSFFAPIELWVRVDVTEPIDVAQDLVPAQEGVFNPDVSAVRALGLSLAELTSLLRGAGPQKELMLLSEGFGGPLLRDARSLHYLQKALRAARDSGWSLHGVDIGGIPGLGEASFTSDSLLFMASGTGGELVENTNDFGEAAGRVLERTEIVYVLTFQPVERQEDGAYHPLEVKLRNPIKGVRVVHRPGYYARRELAEREVYEQRVDAAEWLLTNLEASEIGVSVFAETVTDPLGGTRVPVAVEIDSESLAKIRTRKASRLQLQLAVVDSELRVHELLLAETEVESRADPAPPGQPGVRFVGELALAPGDYRLRVLLRSRRRGEVFLRGYRLPVGQEGESPLPPLPSPTSRPEDRWITVLAESRSALLR